MTIKVTKDQISNGTISQKTLGSTIYVESLIVLVLLNMGKGTACIPDQCNHYYTKINL